MLRLIFEFDLFVCCLLIVVLGCVIELVVLLFNLVLLISLWFMFVFVCFG